MKLFTITNKQFIPASHEDPKSPGALKVVLLSQADVSHTLHFQMMNWALLPVGKKFESHYHEDMDEIFVIMKGTAEIKVDGETAVLKIGDGVHIPMKSIHEMKNIGDDDVHYIALGMAGNGKGKTVNV